jgi:hypothetical protein
LLSVLLNLLQVTVNNPKEDIVKVAEGNVLKENVTPCFPQSVNITILARNHGKLEGVNICFDGPLYKRSINVNYVMNMCYMTVERGMC